MGRRQNFGKPLSPTEEQFMQHLAQGVETKEMATLWWITERGVHARRKSAYGKLGARSAPHAVALWMAPQMDALERIRKLAAELDSSGDMMKMGVAAMIEQRLNGY